MKSSGVAAAMVLVAWAAFPLAAAAQDTVLHSFNGKRAADGVFPAGGVLMDPRGALYGTTQYGGGSGCLNGLGCGTVFKLIPPTATRANWAESVIYRFAGGENDGAFPLADLIMDAGGALFGTTSDDDGSGCVNGRGCGTAFMLSPPASGHGEWTETVLHKFVGGTADGAFPAARLIMAGNGTLYGTSQYGGGSGCSLQGCGTVYALVPPAAGASDWTERILYRFSGDDGARPVAGLIIDANGVLYGTTRNGGGSGCLQQGCGTVFRLDPPAVGQSRWQGTVLHRFAGGRRSGALPAASLIMDADGALYGTTFLGGGFGCFGRLGCGSVFRLDPPAIGRTRWTETLLRSFSDKRALKGNGYQPVAGLIMDAAGSLYGTTENGGSPGCSSAGCGTVFELSPPAPGTTDWVETVLHAFENGRDGAGPMAGLIADANGIFYGTAFAGGAHHQGVVFSVP